MNGKDTVDRGKSKTLGPMKLSESGSAAGPNSQQQLSQVGASSSAYMTQDNVNLEATQKYIKILEDKIREYRRNLVDEQMHRESQTSKAIEELNKFGQDSTKQEQTKRRLQREQGEFTTRTQNIQKNIQKLEFKLNELKAHGIPKQVVPDDYVRQLKKKDAKKHRLLQMPNLLKAKTASSGDLLVGGAAAASVPAGGGSGGPGSVSGVGIERPSVGSPQKKSQSLEHGAAPPPPLFSQQQQQQSGAESVLTVSSSEVPNTGKKTSLSDEEASRLGQKAGGGPPVTFGLGVTGGGGPRSTTSRSYRPPKSRASSSVSSESARFLSASEAAAAAAAAAASTSPAAPAVSCDQTESLREHFEHLLQEQRRALTDELDIVRNRLQDEAGDIHKLVDSEIHKLRYDQQELSASLDDNQKELEKMKVFLTNLSKEFNKLMLVDQQIDDMNNKIAVLSRDLQGPGACPHSRPDSAATTGTRMLNLLVALLSYGFVAASCLINLLLWLLGFLRSRPFVIICVAALLLALLFRQWLALAPLLTPDGLAAAVARGSPQAVRRFLSDLALALNKHDEASAASAADAG
ncbi:hypothetical protein BOX15_Mlig034064g1 [Macrostomum lignano]|uniref:Transmembrane and coiled-coil domains protein 1 n=2 Tax=Macrostomum lignano TaxID=282301 RepID=A0A1I8J2D1_9PLAT|nr:hypothetical protein BOX15_Mlig032931g1 [Macrostomum lignano]PAA80502.1 hypothetical protein BOX15_Mlig034064g1 [Macrostomum lignano]